MYYIQENDKPNFWEKVFCLIRLEGNQIILPIINKVKEQEKLTKRDTKRIKKLVEKTYQLLEQSNSRRIVLSREIQKLILYKNQLMSYPLDVVDGKWLFSLLATDTLDFILEKMQLKKEETNIAVTVNELTDYGLTNIKILAKQYKSVNIVTNHIEKFKKIEETFYEEEGIMITVTNNQRKSLAKAKIILNIDFPQELLNQYRIYEEAVIVNLEGNMKIHRKRFQGRIINDYEINSEKEELFTIAHAEKYPRKLIYEAQFYQKQPFQKAREKIQKDGIKIEKLYLKNGEF